MTQKDKKTSSSTREPDQHAETQQSNLKTCFVIMPIADMEGYEAGHFTRVYEHLIKPACLKAGYQAHRADMVAASNYIIIDILRKIVESDLVVCDLSGRNPNVLYELGVRQAFNLPTVLIKDLITPRIFDIQGLRCADYRHSLRIDEVQKEQENICNVIIETTEKPNDFNSMIQLLGVSPAALPARVELSNDTSLILQSLKNISSRLAEIEVGVESTKTKRRMNPYVSSVRNLLINDIEPATYLVNGESITLGETIWLDGKGIGKLIDCDSGGITLETDEGKYRTIRTYDPEFRKISSLPF
ncbi:hypothetical protein [Pseudomonas fluorescens]|uniref:hypothetical protein n=1 Tax=Pseudomonas fluorescens TaxID=294 RepID=UPI00126A4804|nr:hypothetical protein [Pseudomonas fluorescens]